jgi:hypothetical protein
MSAWTDERLEREVENLREVLELLRQVSDRLGEALARLDQDERDA